DFCVRRRHDLAVAETLDVACLETVDEHPVEAGKVVGASFDGSRMDLLEVARHRAREMHWVLRPRSWARRLKIEFCCDVRCAHGVTCFGQPDLTTGLTRGFLQLTGFAAAITNLISPNELLQRREGSI